MEMCLLKDFEKYLKNETNSSVMALANLCSKYDFNSNSIKNKLKNLDDSFIFNEINSKQDNSSKIINDYFSKFNVKNKNVLRFILHEVIDNMYDHSKFKNAYSLAKNNGGFVDFCLIDDGISIYKSFENNKIDFMDDCTSILMAINGKSTKQINGYVSRGYGLNNIVSLINDSNGSILIVSGCGLIYINNNNVFKKSIRNKCIEGTLIAFRLDLTYDFENFYDIIDGHQNFKED
ncbi:hypothetical protein [Methanobrevibacter millerae]|uniref:Uncharacterized protein n=1 Tax=Methanobrevibacter millerae TaxID=230361 RepID=A0A1G5XB97_9EURY|nr:hypothetical protein [Methanobrevibacter millerae]SDA67681.1 hypothetical protein SAMN02910315_02110 [Methanobrevibacter millerae]